MARCSSSAAPPLNPCVNPAARRPTRSSSGSRAPLASDAARPMSASRRSSRTPTAISTPSRANSTICSDAFVRPEHVPCWTLTMPTDRHRLAREALRERPFFDALNDEEFDQLIDACDLRTLAPREVLWAVGREGQSCFILISGRLEQALTRLPVGRKVEQFDQPGELLGLSYLVKPWRHQSSAMAVER